jgi:PKD repeat protein
MKVKLCLQESKMGKLRNYLIILCLVLLVGFTSAAAPVAEFNGTPRSGPAPLAVQFNDLSSNTPTGWAWFFGDENFTAPWTEMNASAGWTRRYGQSSVAMPDGSIVLMGGSGKGDSYKNDTWRSTDNGITWTQQNASAGWTKRYHQSSVAMPDGSIVLMGGLSDDDSYKNDTWRSTDNGITWTQQTASAGWTERFGQSSVAMPDGSIVLMGGQVSGGSKNDTWRSTDNGITWTQQTASAGWSARGEHTSVAMPDGSIVLMGGVSNDGSYKNDTWRSTDNGITWTQQNASAGWTKRFLLSSVAIPDGSIVLMGGLSDGYIFKNDTWRSTDNGATWTLVNGSSGWSARAGHSSVAMRDGSIVLMGGLSDGNSYKNDVWRFMPASSSAQNQSHTYTTPGNYSVALQSYNPDGYNSTRKTGYVAVGVGVLTLPGLTYPPTDPDGDGIYEDLNGNGRLDFADVVLYFNQMEWIAANEPVTAFDLNGNGRIDFADIVKLFGEI